MTEVLSQDEIDQLLTAISSGEVSTEEPTAQVDQRKIKIYDFKRPDKFSKDQIRTVVRTFREKLFTEIFPGRTDVPKTLTMPRTTAMPTISCKLSARSSARATSSHRRSPTAPGPPGS